MPTRAARDVRLERWAAACMLGSGAVHGILVRSHAQQWWGYGAFFAVASLAQLVFAIALLTDAVNPRDTGPSWQRVKRGLYVAGIAGNLALLVLYVVTRTTGIPSFGPEAGEVEDVAVVDVVAKVLEAVAVVLLAILLRRPTAGPPSGAS